MRYKFCVHCGKKISKNSLFCRYCGFKQPNNPYEKNDPHLTKLTNKINERKQEYRLRQKALHDSEYQKIESYRRKNLTLIIIGWILPWLVIPIDESTSNILWSSLGLFLSIISLVLAIYVYHLHHGFKKNSIVLLIFSICMAMIYLINL